MLKVKGLLFISILIAQFTWAQDDLEVQGAAPGLYIVHTVVAKENWYSVGRLYNLSPKVIAPFNKTTIDKPLVIGQTLKIPLNATNFSQNGAKAADEVFVPVYHVVQEKEWMYRIGQRYNKIPAATLEKWNSIKNDQLKTGMKLVVGYLKVKTAQSALAAQGTKKIVPVTQPKIDQPADQKKDEVKKEADKVVAPPVVKKPDTQVKETDTKTAEKEEPPVKKEEPKVQPPVPTVNTAVNTVAVTGNTGNVAGSDMKGGFFHSVYSETGKATAGNAGVFKSTSGWKDGKYYALMNNVPVGTIIKVTFSSTNKSVFAKVLGQLPDMKESTGLIMRISDAAASELGVENGKFYVDVRY